MNLSIFRPERATDDWLGVRFAKEIATSCDSTTYCNPPRDVWREADEFFLVQLTLVRGRVHAALVELDDRDANTVVRVHHEPIDLNGYDGFINPPEYGFQEFGDARLT